MEDRKDAIEIAGTLFLVLCIFALSMCGCSSCEPEVKTVYQEVKIPIPTEPKPLPIPPRPDWEVDSIQPGEPALEAIRAMARDLLAAWAYSEELRAIIEAHNGAIQVDP